jgi:hypothetical protein
MVEVFPKVKKALGSLPALFLLVWAPAALWTVAAVLTVAILMLVVEAAFTAFMFTGMVLYFKEKLYAN